MPCRPHTFFPLACLLAVASAWPAAAAAQVNQCVRPDGVPLYTDRECSESGATAKAPDNDPAVSGGRRLYRAGCARDFQDLLYEMTSAIDSGDVNRLAGLYHWAGMSGRAGYAVMDRLDALVQRPLVDIVPVMPGDEFPYPQTTVGAPLALRIEQTLANGSTPSRTVFDTHQHLGCWWIKEGSTHAVVSLGQGAAGGAQ